MAISRKQINFIFAAIVILLGVAAAASYMYSTKPVIRSDTPTGNPENTLPKDHPPIEKVEKLASLIQMSEEDPGNADIQLEIGNIYYDLGQYDAAIVAYRKCLDIRPDDPYVETDLATSLHYLDRNDEALEILDNVIKSHPDFAQARYNKGIVLINGKNDIQGGIEILEKLLGSNIEPTMRAEVEKIIRRLKTSVQ